jgi:CDGSH-type Zn-finger protein/uncharacterized Fe-S cluster protein YjdI
MPQPRRYEGEHILVSYDPRRCTHAEACVRGLPEVFDRVRRPWVDPSGAPAARIAEVVMRCPSGALHFARLDGGAEEPTPIRNMVTVEADGPLNVRGDLEIETEDGIVRDTRASLCRCGASTNKPFCDGSHRDAGFSHDGALKLGTPIAPPPSDVDGPLGVRPSFRGPLLLSGVLELRSSDLATYARIQHPALCRCGQSGRKPFCDATHQDVGFRG